MPQPAMGVATSRIVMGPVYHAAFFVPLVLAVELDGIAHLNAGDARRDVDVVGDKDGLARGGLQNKLLVAAAVAIIGKHAGDGESARDLEVSPALLESLGQEGVCRIRCRDRRGARSFRSSCFGRTCVGRIAIARTSRAAEVGDGSEYEHHDNQEFYFCRHENLSHTSVI